MIRKKYCDDNTKSLYFNSLLLLTLWLQLCQISKQPGASCVKFMGRSHTALKIQQTSKTPSGLSAIIASVAAWQYFHYAFTTVVEILWDQGGDAESSSALHLHANPAVQSKQAAASTLHADPTRTPRLHKKTQSAKHSQVKINIAGWHFISEINK